MTTTELDELVRQGQEKREQLRLMQQIDHAFKHRTADDSCDACGRFQWYERHTANVQMRLLDALPAPGRQMALDEGARA